jgi:AhpD family alkylhydroperoxidase
MALLTEREKELVALGASIGSNCVPCAAFHVEAARKAGLPDAAVAEALAVAEKVKNVPASQVMNTARAGLSEEAVGKKAGADCDAGCACS